MAKLVRAKVKKELLVWARVSAGYTSAEAAKRIGVPESRLLEWENGTRSPAIGQLQRLAETYKRPLAVLYLQEPPLTFQPMRDFRRMPGSGLRRISPVLAQEIRSAEQRRQLALELSEESGEPVYPFSLSASLNEEPEAVGGRVREALAVTPSDRSEWRSDPTGYAAFNAWRARIENIGVLVFQSDRIDSDEVSGVAIAADRLPAIVLSRKAASPRRRSFSILHELAHLMLHLSGVSDLEVDASRPPEDQKIEVFCNAVAASTLIPRDALMQEKAVSDHDKSRKEWTDEEIRELAQNFGVSREALVRRLLTFGLTTTSFYERKRAEYRREFKNIREERRESLKASQKKLLRNPPREALSNFGTPLVRMILDSYYQDRMTLSDVSGYLGIRVRHIPTLESIVGFRGRQ